MTVLFQILILNCLIIFGLFEAMYYKKVRVDWTLDKVECDVKEVFEMQDKMFLWFIPYNLRKILPEFWIKPIASCVICMASVHSTYVYWFFYDFNLFNALVYILYVPALAGLNAIVLSFYDK